MKVVLQKLDQRVDFVRPLELGVSSATRLGQLAYGVSGVGELARRTTPAGHSLVRQHRQFKSVCFSGPANSFVVQDDSIMALEYFYTRTLPLFDVSEPNLLWLSLRRDAPSDQSFCYNAAALGLEHMRMARESVQGYREKSCRLNGRALRSMQKCLATQSPAQIAAAAFLSLLLAILQGLRGRQSDMLVHLRCGSTIAQQGIKAFGKTAHPELGRTLRLLRKYCISTMVFDSIGIEADKTAATMGSETAFIEDLPLGWDQNDHTLAAEVDVLVEELMQVMRGFRAPQHDACGNIVAAHAPARAHPCRNPSSGPALSRLSAKQSMLEQALEEKMSASRSAGTSSVLLEFALPRCLLAKIYIYLRCCCYNQSRFEDEVSIFQRILDLERASLLSLRASQQHDSSMSFSLGLGAIGSLVSVARLCPVTQIRHEAIKLLDLCPPTEGFWSVELAWRLCTTILEFEEQLATAAGSAIGSPTSQLTSRQCRVSYHNFGAASEDLVTKVRLFRSMGDTETLSYEDVTLSRPTKPNSTITSATTERPVMEWHTWQG